MITTGRGLYSKTYIKDFYLDLAKIPTSAVMASGKSLERHVVTPRQQYRPDLLSYDLYGSSNHWWTIVLLNRDQLKDPIRDLKAGTVLRVASPDSISGAV